MPASTGKATEGAQPCAPSGSQSHEYLRSNGARPIRRMASESRFPTSCAIQLSGFVVRARGCLTEPVRERRLCSGVRADRSGIPEAAGVQSVANREKPARRANRRRVCGSAGWRFPAVAVLHGVRLQPAWLRKARKVATKPARRRPSVLNCAFRDSLLRATTINATCRLESASLRVGSSGTSISTPPSSSIWGTKSTWIIRPRRPSGSSRLRNLGCGRRGIRCGRSRVPRDRDRSSRLSSSTHRWKSSGISFRSNSGMYSSAKLSSTPRASWCVRVTNAGPCSPAPDRTLVAARFGLSGTA